MARARQEIVAHGLRSFSIGTLSSGRPAITFYSATIPVLSPASAGDRDVRVTFTSGDCAAFISALVRAYGADAIRAAVAVCDGPGSRLPLAELQDAVRPAAPVAP